MIQSSNRRLNFILKYIGKEKLENIEVYVNEIRNREYITFQNKEEISEFFKNTLIDFLNQNTEEENLIVRSYSGYQYKEINAVLRRTWNYEVNGELTEEKERKYLHLAQKIKEILHKAPTLQNNIKVYRGVPISIFKEYNISNLEDLITLRGSYFFDSGFTSTSLIRENSFFNKEIEWHEKCNVEIEYLLPEESGDGLPLFHNELSFSTNQTEYVLNAGNLSKVIDVEVNKEENKAMIKMALIPSKIWDYTLGEEENNENALLK